MAIPGVIQPDILNVGGALRLRRYDEDHSFALAWYQDPETVYLVDGDPAPYTPERLDRMYAYLADRGELYWIEVLEEGRWRPIGDVTFWRDDMPIVIGDRRYRGRGIGRQVVSALVRRGRSLGCDWLRVREIYDCNAASRRCFEAAGFRAYEKTEKGSRYELLL